MAYPVPGYRHLATERPQGTNLDAGQIDLQHLNPKLLALLNTVGAILGKTITIFSAYRSPDYSAKVGGFATDPHTRGVAVDAKIGSTPLGDYPGAMAALDKLGLVSGNQPNFYKGQRDPAHVQLSTGARTTQSTGSGASAIGSLKQFFEQVLRNLGAPVTIGNLALLLGWSAVEGTKAKNNPLATTLPASGASDFNSVGVKNYSTPEAGAKATADTIKEYPGLSRILKSGAGIGGLFGNQQGYRDLNRWSGHSEYGASASPYVKSILLNAQGNPKGSSAADIGSIDLPDVAGAIGGALTPDWLSGLGDLLGWLLDPNNWLRVLQIIAGAALAFAGLLLLARQVALASGGPDPIQLAAGRAGV